jgi:nitroimidazol reductase NimA-like FMN-containing flavoprotein (pyridoxamine 5'-phosphate oxidase superfamily)
MKRQEKQIAQRKEIDAVIHASDVCRLAMARGNEPYLVPLSFGYDGQALYFHTALTGKKIDFIEANHQVCFEFEHQVQVVTNDESACKWSFSFKSVLGYGIVSEIVHPAQKEQGLSHIMRHYSHKQWAFNEKAMAKTRVWKISIQSLTGKQSLQ